MTALRTYQERAVKNVGDKNSIVVMPTGSGKTLVAAECLKIRLRDNLSKKGLFLVPTCNLVCQQSAVIKKWTKLNVKEYKGGISAPRITAFNILVSTPEAFWRLQTKESNFGWSLFSICIFDEVHHVLKHHPYRHLAHGIKKYSEEHRIGGSNKNKIQVIGLSASLTYAVGETGIQKALRNLSQDLSLQNMIRVSDNELIRGGYKPPSDELEIIQPRTDPEGIIPRQSRQPHLMHATFFRRADLNQLTTFANSVLQVVQGLEEVALSHIGSSFKSPLNNISLSSWEKYAFELVKTNPALGTFLCVLESWYVALRLLVQTWEEEQEVVLLWLTINDAFRPLQFLRKSALKEAKTLENSSRNETHFTKVGRLKEQLLQKKALFGSGFRCIVFVQQRITAYILSHFINNDANLNSAGITADYVAARNAKITPRIKATRSAVASSIEKFRCGKLNVLVSTSVIEEGFDVPSSNVVISFDHIKDTVELSQRFGRARQENRRIVVMDQRWDRPIAALKEVKQHQDYQIESFTPSFTTRGESKIDDRVTALRTYQERAVKNVGDKMVILNTDPE